VHKVRRAQGYTDIRLGSLRELLSIWSGDCIIRPILNIGMDQLEPTGQNMGRVFNFVCWGACSLAIGLHHPLDGVTNPENKLLCFIQLTFFSKRRGN
jgi:hypothetical protein